MWCYNSCILSLLTISSLLFKASLAETGLKVGVVEFKPAESQEIPTAKDRMTTNVEKYIKILNNTTLDLIIYPESVLNIHVPVREFQDYTTIVNINDNPCTDNDGKYPEFIKNISCAVRTKGQTYVIINTEEKEKCADGDNENHCKLYGFRFYNTDIIFNNEGTILARYRKYNLFGEFENNTPATIDHTTFTLKNETVGVFTCFDILFKQPPEDLVDGGIKTIAYPTMWFSEIPFLTALQTQQMWSIEHDVNIFAANANNPRRGGGGSGIFYGKSGPVNYDIISEGGTELLTNLVDDLPKNINNVTTEEIDILGQKMDNFTLLADSLKDFTSKLLNTSQESSEYNLCHTFNTTESFCCSFKIKTSKNSDNNDKQYVYHLVAFSGIRSYGGVRNGGIEICAIIACPNASLSSCGHRLPKYDEISWPITFEQIEIRGNYTDKNHTQYPNTLLSSIRPIHPQHFDWEKNVYNTDKGAIIGRILKLKKPQNRLFTFAIFGRNFGLDSPPRHDSNNSNKTLQSSVFLYIVYLIATMYFIMM